MKKTKNISKSKSKAKKSEEITRKFKTDTIHIFIYACGLLTTVFSVFSGIFFSYSNPKYFIWSLFLFFIFMELSFFLFWFSKKPKKYILVILFFLCLITFLLTLTLPQRLIKQVPLPTFSEEINKNMKPVFTLGTSGLSFSNVGTPVIIDGFEPFTPHIKNNNLFVDTKIYSKTGLPPIEIIDNKILNLPHDWDWNSNNIALEIVNDKSQPIYQLVYKKPFKLNIKGIFPSPKGVMIADDTNGVYYVSYSDLPATFKLKRIFKYPSWRYPNEYQENY